MPEILEAEAARALIGARALDREITTVHAPDAWFLKAASRRGVKAACEASRSWRPVVAASCCSST
ncbi:MAG: hypothetical protein U0W40_07340 [Acidimicrobiia bacterium]